VAGDDGLRRDEWLIYRGGGEPHDGIRNLPEPPPWRLPGRGQTSADRARAYQIGPEEVNMVNVALRLRRPLLVTGKPGAGKTSLAHSIAYELKLGPVLRWPITSRSILADGLYSYDAIGRLHDSGLKPGERSTESDIGRYIRLGPLGTALLPQGLPRVLLIDDLDNSDIDLPGDLLSVLEEGTFVIPELERLPDEQSDVEVYTGDAGQRAVVHRGRIACQANPVVVITSNSGRDFAPTFLRRCLGLDLKQPIGDQLAAIVVAHMGPEALARSTTLVEEFFKLAERGHLATDQLLNVLFLVTSGEQPPDEIRKKLPDALLRPLSAAGS